MKQKLLLSIVLLISIMSFGQNPQLVPGSIRYNNISSERLLGIPKDTITPIGYFAGRPNIAMIDDSILYVWSPALGRYIQPRSGAGVVDWGDITGLISSNSQLVDSLNARQRVITPGTSAQYIKGDFTLGNFYDAVIAAGDPRYAGISHSHIFANITDGTVAVRNLLSAGTGISYNSSTGVITATGSVSTAWGDISGTLTNQTDLYDSLLARVMKQDSSIDGGYYPYSTNPKGYITSATNIYTDNGILTGNRTLTGLNETYSLLFDSLSAFLVRKNNKQRIYMDGTVTRLNSPNQNNLVGVEDGFVRLMSSSNANEFYVRQDSTYSIKKLSYPGNIHGTFFPYSLVDKSYVDSLTGTIADTHFGNTNLTQTDNRTYSGAGYNYTLNNLGNWTWNLNYNKTIGWNFGSDGYFQQASNFTGLAVKNYSSDNRGTMQLYSGVGSNGSSWSWGSQDSVSNITAQFDDTHVAGSNRVFFHVGRSNDFLEDDNIKTEYKQYEYGFYFDTWQGNFNIDSLYTTVDTGAFKPVVYNKTTGYLKQFNSWAEIGISSPTPTFQQVLTAGSTMTGSNTVTQNGNQFIWTNSLTSNTTGGFYIQGTGSGGLAAKITTEGRGLYINGSSAGHTPLEIDGHSTGYGIRVNNDGGGIVAYYNTSHSSTNTVLSNPMTQESRFSTGTAANGIGFSNDKNIQDDAGSGITAVQHIYKLTDVTAGSVDGEYSLKMRYNGTLTERFVLSSTGAQKWNAYTATSSFSGTPVGVLGFDASGNILTMATPGGGSQTLQQVFNTEVGGSALTKIDSIQASTFALRMYGSTTGTQFLVANSSTGTSVKGTTTGGGTGVWGETTGNGWGGYFKSVSGNGVEADGGTGTGVYSHTTTGIVFSGQNTGDRTANLPIFAIDGQWASTNSNEKIATFSRLSSGTVADGISGSIDILIENSSAATLTNRLTSRLTTVNLATRTSEFDIDGFNSGTQEVVMRVQPDWVIVNNLADTLSTMAYARSLSGSSSSKLNALTAADGTNTINNVNYAQVWQWNSLAAGTGLKLSTTSTAALDGHRLFEIDMSGTNGTGGQTTEGMRVTNAHVGQANYGGRFFASGATTNYGISASGTQYGGDFTATGGSGSIAVYARSTAAGGTAIDADVNASAGNDVNVQVTSQGASDNHIGINIGVSGAVGRNDAIKVTSGEFLLPEVTAPGTPPTGFVTIYQKTDGKLYSKNDAGTEYDLTATGGGGVSDGDKGDITVSSSGSVWTFNYKRNIVYTTVTGTDANITAVPGTAYNLPAATLSAGRTIDVSGLNTNGDYVEFFNNEQGFIWSFTGATVYDSDGATAVTELLINANSVIRRVNGKLMISKL